MTTREQTNASTGADLIGTVADWLMAQALGKTEVETLLDGCCNRLRAAGIPLFRAHIGFSTLHPLVDTVGLTWHRDRGIETAAYAHSRATDHEAWLRSPYFHMVESGIPFLRRRLTGEEALLDFPVLTDLRDAGATDYLAYLVSFGEGEHDGVAGSWATDRPSGFSDHDIQALLRIQKRLGVACKVTIREQITRNVVTAYLGPDAGLRVLNGHIRRGDGETIHAVIWYSDLRNSTPTAETMAGKDFLAVLNTYFECTAGAVLAAGGEVLLLLGDAVLAIFPIRDGGASEREACESALAAAREAHNRLAEVNRERAGAGLELLAFGLALHVGDVMYGNIGVPERLQFTVVGPAANEVARLEGLAKVLDRPIVASAEFATSLRLAWQSLGPHELKGLGEPREVFAPPQP